MSRHENAVMIMHRPPCYAKRLRRWTRRQPRRWGRNFCIASSRCILFLSRRCDDVYSITYPARTGTFIHADNRFWQGARHRRRSSIAFFFAILPPSACETRGRADAIVATHGGNLLESPIVLPNGCTAPHRAESNRIEPHVSRSILLSRLFRRVSREFSEQLSSLFYGVASFSKRTLFLSQIWTRWSGMKSTFDKCNKAITSFFLLIKLIIVTCERLFRIKGDSEPLLDVLDCAVSMKERR